jgi:hypothetical protein
MTGQTPAKLLLQRKMRTKIPTIQPAKVKDGSRMDSEGRNKDSSEKAKAKEYTDKTRNLAVGDKVLVTQKRKNKYSTQFGKDPMKIIKISGSQIILEDRHGKQQKRNSSLVKKYLMKKPHSLSGRRKNRTFSPLCLIKTMHNKRKSN